MVTTNLSLPLNHRSGLPSKTTPTDFGPRTSLPTTPMESKPTPQLILRQLPLTQTNILQEHPQLPSQERTTSPPHGQLLLTSKHLLPSTMSLKLILMQMERQLSHSLNLIAPLMLKVNSGIQPLKLAKPGLQVQSALSGQLQQVHYQLPIKDLKVMSKTH